MTSKGSFTNTAVFRPISAPRKHSYYYEEFPTTVPSKYTPPSLAHHVRGFQGWYNDSKQREFQALNQYGNGEGISRIRKLVDNHSHAFDLAEQPLQRPSRIQIVIAPKNEVKRYHSKKELDMNSQRNTKQVSKKRGHKKDQNQEQQDIYQRTGQFGVQVGSQEQTQKKSKHNCKCPRCGHKINLPNPSD